MTTFFKIFLSFLSSLGCSLSYGKNIKVQANIFSGCLIESQNVSFGLVSRNTSKTINTPIVTQCSKNTRFTINIEGNNYDRTLLTYYPQMKHQTGNYYIPYKMKIDKNSTSKAKINLGSRDVNAKFLALGNKLSTVNIQTLVNTAIQLNLISTIDVPSNQHSGNYSDTATITLSY